MLNNDDKLKKLQLLRQKKEIKDGLPHLHGFPFYSWAREFYETKNKNAVLVAGNQLSKSSTQIRKVINWATDQTLWSSMWGRRPRQFWYLYPSKDVATIEWFTKWVEFMPNGKFKDSTKYGWVAQFKFKQIWAIHFNSGVSLYFKTYMQDPDTLQTGTCDGILADEELPEELWDEINMRRAATDGYFSMVYTPTLGCAFWMDVIAKRKLVDAWTKEVSLYDCMKYEDGTDSPWTQDRVTRIINSCRSEAEVQRRVFGKSVALEGLKYPTFSRLRNRSKPESVPNDWMIYSGVDIGSGGDTGHPAAIVFVAVRPDFRYGRVIRGRRYDKIQTSAGDVFTKYIELRAQLKVMCEYYDSQSRDFYIIATRAGGTSFQPAFKGQVAGQDILNTLFRNQMLDIDEGEELDPLCSELELLKEGTPKPKAKDDFVDGLRFATSSISWDWEAIRSDQVIKMPEKILTGDEVRMANLDSPDEDELNQQIDDEIEAYNELIEEY